MVNSGMFISVAFLSIVASVAAFGFLITQLIFMCFGRSRKKKRAKQKTLIKNDIDDCGEASGVRLNRVDGDRVNDGNLSVNCDKAEINDDCRLRIDGDKVDCDKQVKNYSVIEGENFIITDTPCDDGGENATGNDKGGDGSDGGNDDGGNDGSKIDSKISGKNGRDDVGDDDGGDGVSDDGSKIDSKISGNNGRDDGGGETDNDGGVDDCGGEDDGDDSVSDDGNKMDSKRSGDNGRDGGEGDDEGDSNEGNKIDSKISGNNIGDHGGGDDDGGDNDGDDNDDGGGEGDDEGGSNDANKIDSKISGNNIGDDGGHDDDVGDNDGVSDDGSKIDNISNGDDGFVCGNNIGGDDGAVNGGDDYEKSNDSEGDNGGGVDGDYGSRHDIKNGDDGLDVADMNLNIDGEQVTVIDDSTETRDKDDANTMHKCCSFKHKETATGESDLMHTNNCCETSNGTHGKTLPGSCNQCACQCSHIGINGSNGQATHKDHDALHIKKQRIQFKLDVDITKYQIDDGNEKHPKTSTSRNFGEHFSDGEVIDNHYVQNDLVNQTRNIVSSFWPENALCDNVSTREITSKCKNRSCCSNVQQNMIKDENSVKFYSGRQIVREKTMSNTNDNEYLIKDTTDTSRGNCRLILDDNFNEDEPPFGLKKISADEPKTRDIAIQVFEGCTSCSGRNSPTVFDGIGNSTRNSSTISCCCSSEYEYGREMDSVSSSDSSESLHFDENICAREHSINMDCVENNFGHESKKKFGKPKEDAANSSIVRRFLSAVVNFAECCISALNGSAQNE